MTDRTLTTVLADLAIDFPKVPDLEATFARLGASPVRRTVRTLRWVVAALIVVTVAVLTLVAPVREAVADWLGIGVIRIVEVEELPAGLVGTMADLGDPIGVEDAGSWPAVLGRPNGAFTHSAPDTVAQVWLPGEGLPEVGTTGVGALLSRFEGTLEGPIIEKGVGPDTKVIDVMVGGAPGYWVAGEAHTFGYLDPDGEVVYETLRLAGNTLLWESSGIGYRFESGLGLAEAIEVAESIGR